MNDKLLRNPLALFSALLASALLGAGAFALVLALVPSLAGPAIRGYLLEHPEILPEAMDRLQTQENARQEKAQQAAGAKVRQHLAAVQAPFGNAWAGNPNGDVTVVAFMDYACGYCRASLPGIAELLQKDAKVRVVYREFPVLGPESGVAARWALAAAQQGKFREFHDAMYAAGQPTVANIDAAVAKAGLDRPRAEAAIRSKAVDQEIRNNHALGAELAMNGTPSWVIGGRLVYGARDYAGLAEAVAAARAGR